MLPLSFRYNIKHNSSKLILIKHFLEHHISILEWFLTGSDTEGWSNECWKFSFAIIGINHILNYINCGESSKRQTQSGWRQASERERKNKKQGNKSVQRGRVSKINRKSGVLVVLCCLCRWGSVQEGRVQVRGQSPVAAHSPLFNQGPEGSQLTSLAAWESLYAPFKDPWGHQRAYTGKRLVSRVEVHSQFKQRRWWGSSYIRCAQSHTSPALALPGPILSHTPTPVGSLVKGGDYRTGWRW